MAQRSHRNVPSGRDIYEASLSGAQNRPFIPRLRSDPSPYHPLARTLDDFRGEEGRENRKRRLQALWKHICKGGYNVHQDNAKAIHQLDGLDLTPEKAEALRASYEHELLQHCGGDRSEPGSSNLGHIKWRQFKEYAEAKEVGAS